MTMKKTDEAVCTSWYEAWADHRLHIPYILLVMPEEEEGAASVVIIDPKEGNNIVYDPAEYADVKSWLLEDEYTRVDGRMTSEVNP